MIFLFSLCPENCRGPNATLQGPAQEQFLGCFYPCNCGIFSAGSGEEDRQSAVILRSSSGAFNLSAKELFTVNYLDHLSLYIFHRSISVYLKSQEFTLFRSTLLGDFRS